MKFVVLNLLKLFGIVGSFVVVVLFVNVVDLIDLGDFFVWFIDVMVREVIVVNISDFEFIVLSVKGKVFGVLLLEE